MAKRKSRKGLKEEEKRKLNKENLSKLGGIFKFILPYKTAFILGMICLVLSTGTLMAFPYLLGKLVDAASGKADWYLNDINGITIALVLVLVLQSIFSYSRVLLYAHMSEKAMADVRISLYSKLMRLPMSFFDKSRVGELTSRMTTDISLLQETFSTTLAEFVRQILTLVIGTSVLFVMATELTVFMLSIFPIIIIFGLVFGKRIRAYSKKTQDKLALANVIVEETFHAIATVKSFTNEGLEIKKYKNGIGQAVKAALKGAGFRGAFISFIIFVGFGGLVAVMWYGANLVASDQMDTGELFSFVLFTAFIAGSIAGLGDMFGQIQKAIGASERVLDILSNEPAEAMAEATNITFEDQINLSNIAFSYPSRKEEQVLNGLSLSINKGERIALVGHSGAGKSTVVQLLMRFYDVNAGSIRIDDKNIYDYNLNSYRQLFGMVPQEVLLFGGSIAENIGYGNPDADFNAIMAAAKKANALDFINDFQDGFETIVGDRGTRLSGGQKQRIAIARAILKDPEILILDEATSALDSQSELLVQGALDNLMEGRTTIMIAHRLSTIRKADKIIVLDKGVIVESGIHQELLLNGDGIYANLVKLQYEVSE